jgi:cyclase
MKQVAPQVYLETRYASGNVGLIITGAGIICVDMPMLPSDVRHWQDQIAALTDEPIIFVIQSDYDRQRVIGASMLQAPIIAHDTVCDKMRIYHNEKTLSQINEMIRRDGGQKEWQVRMPDITFSERLILYKGEREIHILHGGGHSAATCMTYLPQENLIFTGDLVFSHQHPTMTQAETKQWLSKLNQLRKMTIDIIIPGHGAICDKEATHPLSDYIRDMRAVVRRNFQAGRSKSETSSAVIPEFMDAFPYDENQRDRVRQRIKGGSDRIYDEYRAVAKASATKSRAKKRNKRRD